MLGGGFDEVFFHFIAYQIRWKAWFFLLSQLVSDHSFISKTFISAKVIKKRIHWCLLEAKTVGCLFLSSDCKKDYTFETNALIKFLLPQTHSLRNSATGIKWHEMLRRCNLLAGIWQKLWKINAFSQHSLVNWKPQRSFGAWFIIYLPLSYTSCKTNVFNQTVFFLTNHFLFCELFPFCIYYRWVNSTNHGRKIVPGPLAMKFMVVCFNKKR